jgi:pimeloyl-ACP methyl ester carboxylesterase
MPHLDLPGTSLYYETEGHVSSPALLLIHAGVATLRMWDGIVAALAENHFVIRFDTRGYGATTSQDVPFSDRDDAIDLLDHLGIARATVIGCSRGGRIAIDLAVEHPERVAGLVTIGSGPSGFPETELTEAEDALFDELDAAFAAEDWNALQDLEVRLWSIGPNRHEDDLDPAFVAEAYALNRANAAHRGESSTPIPLDPPAYDRLVDIDVPTLVTVGDHDLSVVLIQYAYLLTTIPRAEGCRFTRSAHLPSVEQADQFERVLLGWLAENGL